MSSFSFKHDRNFKCNFTQTLESQNGSVQSSGTQGVSVFPSQALDIVGIKPDPDLGGIGIVLATLVSSILSVICTLLALFLRPTSRERIMKYFPRIEAVRKNCRPYYISIQTILSSIASQQLVIAISLLSVVLFNRDHLSLYHLWMVSNYIALSHNCFINCLEFENLPLPENEVHPNCRSHDLNEFKVFYVFVYMVLSTVFNVIAVYPRCLLWDETDPQNCYQKTYEMQSCLTPTIIFTIWQWAEFLTVLHRRTRTMRAISAWVGNSIACHVSKTFPHRVYRKMISTWQDIGFNTYVISLIIWFVLNVYDILDLKISNSPIIEKNFHSSENDWSLGQAMVVFILLLLSILLAESATKKESCALCNDFKNSECFKACANTHNILEEGAAIGKTK